MRTFLILSLLAITAACDHSGDNGQIKAANGNLYRKWDAQGMYSRGNPGRSIDLSDPNNILMTGVSCLDLTDPAHPVHSLCNCTYSSSDQADIDSTYGYLELTVTSGDPVACAKNTPVMKYRHYGVEGSRREYLFATYAVFE